MPSQMQVSAAAVLGLAVTVNQGLVASRAAHPTGVPGPCNRPSLTVIHPQIKPDEPQEIRLDVNQCLTASTPTVLNISVRIGTRLLPVTAGVWVHFLYLGGRRFDYYENTDNSGQWGKSLPSQSKLRSVVLDFFQPVLRSRTSMVNVPVRVVIGLLHNRGGLDAAHAVRKCCPTGHLFQVQRASHEFLQPAGASRTQVTLQTSYVVIQTDPLSLATDPRCVQSGGTETIGIHTSAARQQVLVRVLNGDRRVSQLRVRTDDLGTKSVHYIVRARNPVTDRRFRVLGQVTLVGGSIFPAASFFWVNPSPRRRCSS
jgi:hypothetical protein